MAAADRNAGVSAEEDTLQWKHPTMLARTWKRAAEPVLGAIPLPSGEPASFPFLLKEIQDAPATQWSHTWLKPGM